MTADGPAPTLAELRAKPTAHDDQGRRVIDCPEAVLTLPAGATIREPDGTELTVASEPSTLGRLVPQRDPGADVVDLPAVKPSQVRTPAVVVDEGDQEGDDA